jgi:hypothetical protein
MPVDPAMVLPIGTREAGRWRGLEGLPRGSSEPMPVNPLAMPGATHLHGSFHVSLAARGRLQGLAWRAEASTVTASAAEHFKEIRRQGISC